MSYHQINFTAFSSCFRVFPKGVFLGLVFRFCCSQKKFDHIQSQQLVFFDFQLLKFIFNFEFSCQIIMIFIASETKVNWDISIKEQTLALKYGLLTICFLSPCENDLQLLLIINDVLIWGKSTAVIFQSPILRRHCHIILMSFLEIHYLNLNFFT